MLRAEPLIGDVLPRLHRFVEDTVIVGHNVAFDMRFFATPTRAAASAFANPVLDTLLLECAINANQEDKSLEAIAAAARHPGHRAAHRAGRRADHRRDLHRPDPAAGRAQHPHPGRSAEGLRDSPFARLTA